MAPRRSGTTDPPGLVCVGVVSGARGLKGDVRIRSFTAEPEDVAAYGPVVDENGAPRFDLAVVGMHKKDVIVRIDGVADRTEAEALKGVRLYVPRTALPAPEEDEYYHADLVGLDAEIVGGETLGTVKAVHDFGAGDVLEIDCGTEGPVMVPFTRAAVPEVDIAGGRIVIAPMPGLLGPSAEDENEEGEEKESR